MPEITRSLAELVTEYPAGAFAAGAVEEVKRALLDLLGVTVVGATEPAGRHCLAYARSQAAAGPAAVIGGGVRLAPTLAALVNGTAGHALDLDDIGLGAGHVSVAIMPAALAVAELIDAPGDAFIDAMILGYEVAHRLTRMYPDSISGPYAFGYHKPSLYSTFGATAAVGRLLGVNTDTLRQAFGIAGSEAGGLRINFGTMTKPFHAGLACRTGVESVLLAREGFTASPVVIEGRFGWHDVLCRGEGDLSLVVADPAPPFAVEEGLRYKMYPCCGANHHAIEAVLALMAGNRLQPDDIASIDVTIEARTLRDVLVYPWPASGLEAKFSLAYNVAAAMVDGAVTVDTFTDGHLGTLAPARDKIRVLPKEDMSQHGAYVTIRTTDGRTFQREQLTLKGNIEDPLTWDDLVHKFTTNVAPLVKDDAIAEVVAAVESLEAVASLGAVTEPLLGGAS
jgi:2-methylcitrate dehydratase PrpD